MNPSTNELMKLPQFSHDLGSTLRPSGFGLGLLRIFGLLWLGASLAGTALCADLASKPNIIVIVVDDLGYGDLGCYGHPKFKTPNIDRMAAEGARLTQFYAPAPYCNPSRFALMTGRYEFRAAEFGQKLEVGWKTSIPTEEVTLGEAMKSAGYATALVGKWHLGDQPDANPVRHGFDEFFGALNTNDKHPFRLLEGERVVEYPVVQATLTRRLTERSLSFIDRNQTKPFLLCLMHIMVHKPLACSEDFYEKSGGGLYGDTLAEVDWSVGQIMAKLRELNLDKQTLMLLTSDNGPWFGGSTRGLRGMKLTNWEGGHRLPLLARWPGRIPAGHVSHQPAALQDLFATALKAADVAPPADRRMDGRDILPLLTGDAPSPHDALFYFSGRRVQAVRSGQWKLHVRAPSRGVPWLPPGTPWKVPTGKPDGIRILAPETQPHPSEYPGLRTGDKPVPMMLFDLGSDPGEQHNVAAEHPEIVARLKALASKITNDDAADHEAGTHQ